MAVACLTIATTAQAQVVVRSDAQLRSLIEKHVWYSYRHGYQFLSNGTVAVDGNAGDGSQRWSIKDGLLYREYKGSPQDPPTKIIEINDRQLVEQEISGQYKGSVEVMYSQRPNR
jgi:hypothetical protein